MRNAIILHGKPTKERYDNPDLPKPHDANWLPWLRCHLAERGIAASIPQLPSPYFPVYEDWKNEFESHEVNENTGLIGHSAGADFILQWFSANQDVHVERVVLVAPWHDTARKYGDFSQYDLDKNLARRVGRITIFNSLDDNAAIKANVQRLTRDLPSANLVELNGFGHFILGDNMSSQEFPELLAELDQ